MDRSGAPRVIEGVRFGLREAHGVWVVGVIWHDGAPGLELSFHTRADAEAWLDRDAAAWLRRLNDASAGMPASAQGATRDGTRFVPGRSSA